MRPLIMNMLVVDVALFLVTAYGVAMRNPTEQRPVPIWSSFALSLIVTGNVTIQIANDHARDAGADLLAFVGPLLFGMGIMALFLLIRQRLDARGRPAS